MRRQVRGSGTTDAVYIFPNIVHLAPRARSLCLVALQMPSLIVALVVILITTTCLFAANTAFKRRADGRRLPPGPPGWPLIGNLLDMPRSEAWHVFNQWTKQYGMYSSTARIAHDDVNAYSSQAPLFTCGFSVARLCY